MRRNAPFNPMYMSPELVAWLDTPLSEDYRAADLEGALEHCANVRPFRSSANPSTFFDCLAPDGRHIPLGNGNRRIGREELPALVGFMARSRDSWLGLGGGCR